jgi:hypothetical protein
MVKMKKRKEDEAKKKKVLKQGRESGEESDKPERKRR